MKRWAEYDYGEQMALIANALGVRYWSTADSIAEDIADLLDKLHERDLHGAYVRHLAELRGVPIDSTSPDRLFFLIVAPPDVCYHAAARALGIEV